LRGFGRMLEVGTEQMLYLRLMDMNIALALARSWIILEHGCSKELPVNRTC
jgi:hypothetical protein